MGRELVSKKLRNDFREFLVGWTVSEIRLEFEAARIRQDPNHEPNVHGVRRKFIEQHFATLDFTDPADLRRLISFFEGVLRSAKRKIPETIDPKSFKRAISNLLSGLKKEGMEWEGDRIVGVNPEIRSILDAIEPGNTISKYTRQAIFDIFGVSGKGWQGKISQSEFLSRLFNLEKLPSNDSRFPTAGGDIWQHTENNDDWPDEWVFSDDRFKLLSGPDERFLQFICETIHPVVRKSTGDVESLLAAFNKLLAEDGWELVPRTTISGRPVFGGRKLMSNSMPGFNAAKGIAQRINAEYIANQITRLEASSEKDPELAIGTAKEFVETVCKTILKERLVDHKADEDLPGLVKLVREQLALLPENIPNKTKGYESIKKLLSNLGTIAQSMAEIRGLYGTGHGKHAKTSGLEARHAKLAIGAASTLAVFLYETHAEKNRGEGQNL